MDGMRPRWIAVIVAVMLLVFGGFSLHYTSAEDVDHHREWAAEHDMPPPQPAVTVVGWISMAAGLGILVAQLRPRCRGAAPPP